MFDNNQIITGKELNMYIGQNAKDFQALEDKMNLKFEAIDRRFEAIDRRFEAIEDKITGLIDSLTWRIVKAMFISYGVLFGGICAVIEIMGNINIVIGG